MLVLDLFFNPARHVDYLGTFLRFNFELGFLFGMIELFKYFRMVNIYGWPSLMFITNMVMILGSDRYIPGNLN